MPPRSRQPGPGQLEIAGQESRPALVHILTPEFQNIDPADFSDIPDEFVRYVHPAELRDSLFETPDDGRSVVSYQTPDSESWIRLVVTPGEFSLFARHIPMLAKTAINGVFNSRDKKLREATGNPMARARTDQDRADAERSAMRQVMKKQADMSLYVSTDIIPRRQVIRQFKEMTKPGHQNLARGNYQTARDRVERLRTYVFGDMLDAIGHQREWTEAQAELAHRTFQKRLYMDPDKGRRVRNFQEMLMLAEEYYGHKYALVLGRISQAAQYQRAHPKVLADVRRIDAERAAEQ